MFDRKPKEMELMQELIRIINRTIGQSDPTITASHLGLLKSLIIGYTAGRGYFLNERMGLNSREPVSPYEKLLLEEG